MRRFAWALCIAALQISIAAADDDGVVIRDVTLISPERDAPLRHAYVVIRGGRIAEIGTGKMPAGAGRTIDGRGRFLIPGLIDSHVHAGNIGPVDADHPGLLEDYRSQLPRSYLAFGFTTLVDLNAKPATLAWFNRAPLHPGYYHCGQAVEIVGGYPSFANPKDKAEADRVNLVYDPAQSEHWPAALDRSSYTPADAVRRAGDAGAICVKVFVEHGFGGAAHWPVPSRETLDALRAASVARGLAFVVHANAVESWRAALDAHADVIAHGLWHWPGDLRGTTPPVEARTIIRRAAASHIAVQPTLQAVFGDESIFDRSLLRDPRLAESLPPTVLAWLTSGEGEAAARSQADEYRSAIARLLGPIGAQKAMSIAPSRAMATLRLMLDDHVRLLFGTDTPSNEGIGNPPGLNGRLELGRWAEAGVPLGRILRAATVDNAKAFHLSADVGTIEVGKRADLLLLRSDPLKTIHAYDTIDTVFLNGVPISRDDLVATRAVSP